MTATVERPTTRQVTNMDTPPPFDPLVQFYGLWNAALADEYLPLPALPGVKYECWDGYLFMSPYERAENSFGEAEMIALLRPGAKAAGLRVYGTVNLKLGTDDRWIQPDLTILRGPTYGKWVPSDRCVMVIEFISQSSRNRDRIDKPLACATAGIPWFMTVELDPEHELAQIDLQRLVDGKFKHVATAKAGQRFEMTEPFAASFDPAELWDR